MQTFSDWVGEAVERSGKTLDANSYTWFTRFRIWFVCGESPEWAADAICELFRRGEGLTK
jgi:hypothetical protein